MFYCWLIGYAFAVWVAILFKSVDSFENNVTDEWRKTIIDPQIFIIFDALSWITNILEKYINLIMVVSWNTGICLILLYLKHSISILDHQCNYIHFSFLSHYKLVKVFCYLKYVIAPLKYKPEFPYPETLNEILITFQNILFQNS